MSDDAQQIAALHVASWRAAYRAELPEHYLAGLDVNERAEKWRQRIAGGAIVLTEKQADSLIGFCACSPSRDADADRSAVWEIQALHVSPSLRGGGIGTRLLLRTLELARTHGAKELTLWVVKTNLPARRFYECHGMVADGATQTAPVAPGISFDEVRYRRPITLPDSPSE